MTRSGPDYVHTLFPLLRYDEVVDVFDKMDAIECNDPLEYEEEFINVVHDTTQYDLRDVHIQFEIDQFTDYMLEIYSPISCLD